MNNLISRENAQPAKIIPPPPPQDFRFLPLAQVRVRNNYRQTFDPVKLEELAASIRTRGVLQPVLVREVEPDAFEIVAGGRRFRGTTGRINRDPGACGFFEREDVLNFV
jgi:ParB-like nuclease domain